MTDLGISAASPTRLAAQLGGIYAIWLREVKRAIRDRGQFIGGVSRPLLWVLILGIGLNPYFRGEIYGEVRFVVPYTYLQFIFPAVIALNIMYTSVQSAVSTIWDREFDFLREILVSPMPRFTILLGGVLGILVGLAYLGSSALAAVGASYAELLVGRVLLGLSESMVITGSLAWGIAPTWLTDRCTQRLGETFTLRFPPHGAPIVHLSNPQDVKTLLTASEDVAPKPRGAAGAPVWALGPNSVSVLAGPR